MENSGRVAQEQAESIKDIERLDLLIVEISVAQTAEEARQRILEAQ